jgi:hypothetical protein
MPIPLDHPTRDRPHRLYFALTNHCNRSCPWCSTCSTPSGSTYMTLEQYRACFPREGQFQVQLEGGEPTIHPLFWQFVEIARDCPSCTHLVLCTNGVVLPRQPDRLRDWISRLGSPLTVKLSINHHLLDSDPGLIDLAVMLRDLFTDLGGERLLVLNVRLRRGCENDDSRVKQLVEAAGLLPIANIFFLQRYGFAAGETDWDLPAPVWYAFTLVNPDGQTYGTDLIARSEGMRRLE